MPLLSSKDVRVLVILVALVFSNGSPASIPRERRVGEGWIINGIPMSIDHVAFNRHTGERPEYNRIANNDLGNEEPAFAISNNNIVYSSKPPPPMVAEKITYNNNIRNKDPALAISSSKPPPLVTEGSVVINDNVVSLPPPVVHSLEKPNESILERADVKLVDDVKTGLKTETDKQGSAEIVKDVKTAEDPDLKSFETKTVKEETEATLMKDIKAEVDSDLEASEIAHQESGPSVTKVNVEDDWGDFEEAFGDEKEVGEGNEEVIGGDENLNDLLHADSDEEVVDGPDNDDVNGDQIVKDMDAADGKVVI